MITPKFDGIAVLVSLGLCFCPITSSSAIADLIVKNESKFTVRAVEDGGGNARIIPISPNATVTLKPGANANTDAWYFYFDTAAIRELADEISKSTDPNIRKLLIDKKSFATALNDVAVGGISNRHKEALMGLRPIAAPWNSSQNEQFLRLSVPVGVLNPRNGSVSWVIKGDTPDRVNMTRTAFNVPGVSKVIVPNLLGSRIDRRKRAEIEGSRLVIESQELQWTLGGGPITIDYFGQKLTIQPGEVFEQDPPPGTSVPEYTRIYLRIVK